MHFLVPACHDDPPHANGTGPPGTGVPEPCPAGSYAHAMGLTNESEPGWEMKKPLFLGHRRRIDGISMVIELEILGRPQEVEKSDGPLGFKAILVMQKDERKNTIKNGDCSGNCHLVI